MVKRGTRAHQLAGGGASLLLGCCLALLGWLASERFRAVSLEQLALSTDIPDDRWKVVLLFTPEECPSRMKLVDQLNRLKSPAVRVEGILVADTLEFANWRDLIIANRISFPVRAIASDRVNRARSRLGMLPTPLLLVFDPQRRLRVATDIATEAALDVLPAQIAAARRNRPLSALTAP